MKFEIFKQNFPFPGSEREYYVKLVCDSRTVAQTRDGFLNVGGARHAIDLIISTGEVTPVVGEFPSLDDDRCYDKNGLRYQIFSVRGGGNTLESLQSFKKCWHLLGRGGEEILRGIESYRDETDCMAGISLIKALSVDTVVEVV